MIRSTGTRTEPSRDRRQLRACRATNRAAGGGQKNTSSLSASVGRTHKSFCRNTKNPTNLVPDGLHRCPAAGERRKTSPRQRHRLQTEGWTTGNRKNCSLNTQLLILRVCVCVVPEVRQQNQRGPRQRQVSDGRLLWKSDQRQNQLWYRSTRLVAAGKTKYFTRKLLTYFNN